MTAAESTTSKDQNLKDELYAEARALGLACIGVVGLETSGATEAGQRLRDFLRQGRHGDMNWMAETAERRSDPKTLWPEAKSAILIGDSYAPASDPLAALTDTVRGVISVYAKGRDYHDVLKSKIRRLARGFGERSGADVKIFVDTAPLMEKPLAALAGLGWQGKHTNLVSRTHGSWLFLGAILTTTELPPDRAEADHCGSCQRCLDICPTKAFPAPHQLDARRCLAYLSIEHKGQIGKEFRKPMGNRVFGCDDCLAVCPWNKFAQTAHEARYSGSGATGNPPIAELLQLDDATFRTRFAGTPVKRTGRDRVVRNALVAAGNASDPSLVAVVEPLLADASPLVRGMAVWALRQLGDADCFATLYRTHSPREHDDGVREEWRDALSDGPA